MSKKYAVYLVVSEKVRFVVNVVLGIYFVLSVLVLFMPEKIMEAIWYILGFTFICAAWFYWVSRLRILKIDGEQILYSPFGSQDNPEVISKDSIYELSVYSYVIWTGRWLNGNMGYGVCIRLKSGKILKFVAKNKTIFEISSLLLKNKLVDFAKLPPKAQVFVQQSL